jgi:hypothetical protein
MKQFWLGIALGLTGELIYKAIHRCKKPHYVSTATAAEYDEAYELHALWEKGQWLSVQDLFLPDEFPAIRTRFEKLASPDQRGDVRYTGRQPEVDNYYNPR